MEDVKPILKTDSRIFIADRKEHETRL